jgi:hypothetical protein
VLGNLQSSTFLSACLLLLLIVGGSLIHVAAVVPSQETGNVFYFHNVAQLYRNQNASITLLEEANPTPPTEVTPQVVEVASAIRNATSIFGDLWVGTVAWITEPLFQATSIEGSVVFSVWLSAEDNSNPTFSGVGAGIALLNQQNETVGEYAYTYSYAQGSILPSAPREYDFTVDWNRHIGLGQRVVLVVGVGSTTEGWRVNVNYDAAQYPSRAQLPAVLFVVPEFTQPIFLLAVVYVIITAFRPALRKSFKRSASDFDARRAEH